MMTSDLITAYSLAFTGFVSSAILISKEISRRNKENHHKRAEDVNLDQARVYDEFHSLISSVKADRGLILYTSNGGGIPAAGKNIYTSILYEVIHSGDLEPIREEFQNVLLDEQYTYMLRDVIEKGIWTMDDLQSMKDGFLKRLYEREGVVESMVIPLFSTQKEFYYISIRWCSKPKTSAGTRRSLIEGKRAPIKAILQK